MTAELSVVIPAFNAEATLGEQLMSLRAQEWTGTFEVIVVDNGSTDGTAHAFELATSEDERFRLVDAADQPGATYARNIGVAASTGVAIAFCDADDIVGDGWVAAVGGRLRDVEFMTGPQELGRLNPDWLRGAHGNPAPDSLQTFAEIFPFGPTANLGITRSAFERLGGFDTSIVVFEDMEFCLRAWQLGIRLEYVPMAIVHYRLRATMRALWSQAISYGEAAPYISRRLKEMGKPTPPHLRNAKNVFWLIRRLPRLRNAAGRARWVVVAGGLLGRLRGSWRYRYVQI